MPAGFAAEVLVGLRKAGAASAPDTRLRRLGDDWIEVGLGPGEEIVLLRDCATFSLNSVAGEPDRPPQFIRDKIGKRVEAAS